MIEYVCTSCGSRHAVSLHRWRCDCGAPLGLDFEAGPPDLGAVSRRPASLWRYHEALPLAESLAPVSLGGGVAPVVDDRLGDTPVHLALEYVSPTGSYKDRGAALLVSVAAALGAAEVVDDTSGNAGIALAAHAAQAGLAARIFVPADAPEAKPRIASRLGAVVVRVEGGRAAASAAAVEATEAAFYASHAWNPFFLHGTKTLAYSLSEALRWSAPGAILVPAGNGALVLGLDLGFRELRRHGIVAHRPAIVAVQAERCAPLHAAFVSREPAPAVVSEGATIADGIRVAAPPRGTEVLAAVRQSGGSVEAVSEDEIASALRELWARGYVVEPTSAVPAALVLREGASLRRRYGDLVVALTGSGLKG